MVPVVTVEASVKDKGLPEQALATVNKAAGFGLTVTGNVV
jgi:hypothetical protein